MPGQFQDSISFLSNLELYRYENIFRLYKEPKNGYFYYNILKKIKIPDDINEQIFDFVKLPQGMPLTTLSFRIYGTTYLWWLILVVNNVTNPMSIPAGERIRFVKKAFIKTVLENIKQQLQ
jgi:hypothetical protein